ncbi:MAG TPA: hypothetical protein VHL52_10040 [Acidimicrobiia bacterium]|nr:hypothetical protein [Acidimicrobiia bacterium]
MALARITLGRSPPANVPWHRFSLGRQGWRRCGAASADDHYGFTQHNHVDYARDEPAGCDPSYPTVCIPPPPPGLDSDRIPYRRFSPLLPDPHMGDALELGVLSRPASG